MGWLQTRDTPTPPPTGAATTGMSTESISVPAPFGNTAPARTVVVMNDELLRHGLVHVLSQDRAVQFVGELAHSPGLAEQLNGLRPALLIVGVEAGPHLAALLSAMDPAPAVLAVIDGADPAERVLPMISAGADAVLDRRSPSSELRAVIRRVADGHRALDSSCAQSLIDELREQADPGFSDTLTRREREVLNLVVEGLENRAIAGALFISEATVKFHLHNIKGKFGVHSRAALVATALRARDHA